MIHAKITPSLVDGFLHICVEWVTVGDDGEPSPAQATESFRVAPQRSIAYFSRAAFPAGTFLPGSFHVDEEGRRHHHVVAEAGVVGLVGREG